METLREVHIVGGGFSGLSLAYYLQKKNIPVKIFEVSDRLGGLIHTYKEPQGLVETAANGFLATLSLEQMCKDLKIELLSKKKAARKRYIFIKGKPRRWPLGFKDSLKIMAFILRFVGSKQKLAPERFETVQKYIERCLSPSILSRFVAPALQGIYAGDVSQMSASLLFCRVFGLWTKLGLSYYPEKISRGKLRGTVAPKDGMGSLILALERRLRAEGVKFELAPYKDWNSATWTVLATAAWEASEILKPKHLRLSQQLTTVESLSLVSATLFFPKDSEKLEGFGCLFGGGEGFRSLGVLTNSSIFEGRSSFHSETWILGGHKLREVKEYTEQEALEIVLNDREKLFGKREIPLSSCITLWPRALPHYTVEWEKQLAEISIPDGVWLHGNYLGRIGLSEILERSRELAESIGEKWSAWR